MNTTVIDKAAHLLTPRKDIAERSPGVSRSDLVSSQRLKRIEAVYLSSERTFDDMTEAADEVGAMVRQTLLFGALGTKRGLWSYDAESDSTVTNCYGHTVIASELLEAIEVPHTISFANGHSFVTLCDEESDSVHMVDPPAKDLFLDIDDAVRGPRIAKQLGDVTNQFATNLLNTDILMLGVNKKHRSTLVEDYPWLTVDSPLRPAGTGVPSKLRSTDLIMRTYRPQLGRQVVQDYGLVLEAMYQNEFEEAAKRMQRLMGVYPEVESRKKLGPATSLRHELGKRGLYGAMQDVAAVIDSSLVTGGFAKDNTKNQYFWADTIRHIGAKAEDPEILLEAAKLYDGTSTMSRAKRTYTMTLHKKFAAKNDA